MKESAMRARPPRPVLALRVGGWATLAALAGILAIDPSASAAGALKVSSPAEGATVAGSDVTVTIELSDVVLVPPPNSAKKDDFHVIYALDVDSQPFLDGRTRLGGTPNKVVHTARKTFTGLTPGPHSVTVILVHADHTAVQPPVTASVSFVVAR
jgi:hypothetical protein